MYKGMYQRSTEKDIREKQQVIFMNWMGMSEKEIFSGGADKCTELLLDAGYRPDGHGASDKIREAYINGEKVDGRYVRLPQEKWVLAKK